MDEIQNTGCFSQVSQPSEDITTLQSQVSPFPSWNTFPGLSSQQTTASLTTTTVPVWVHAPPRTQILRGGSNQEFASTNPSTFPPIVTTSTHVTSNPASFFVFSAPKALSPFGQSGMNKPHPTFRSSQKQQFPLTMPTTEPFQNGFCLPSTTASSMFLFSPGPSTSATHKTLPSTTVNSMLLYSSGPFNSGAPLTSAGNVFSNMGTITLPVKEDFKVNSYPPLPTERRNHIFNWNSTSDSSQWNNRSASSQSTNRNTFGLRGSWFNAINSYPEENFNTSGQSSFHPNNRLPAKFIPPREEETYGRIQSITAMAEYSSKSFEELRLEYYKMQKKKFVFGSSAFSFNTPYFFSSGNKEIKQLVHKEVQTSGDNESDTVCVKGLLNEIWRILECIICLDTVKSPIMQCESGHHFCNHCWSKVTVCPVCKRNKTNVRNYALESMLEKLPTSCRYHDEGCEAMVIPKDKEKHESSCCFRPFICPIESCTQKVDQQSLMSHCVTSHDICISVVECTLDNRSYVWNGRNVELRKYICVFNLLQWGVFLLCHKEVEHTSCIWMQLLYVNSKDSNFMYEIQLSDAENCQSVSYKGPITCLSFNTEEAKHKCLRISSELLFAMRSASLQIKLEIWKKNLVPT